MFEGTLVGGTTPIAATIEWWWADSSGNESNIKTTEMYTFSNETAEQVTTTLSASLGAVLTDSHWVHITWNNESGLSEDIESNRVYCYEGPDTD